MFAGGAKGPLPFCGLKKESNVQEKTCDGEVFTPCAFGKTKKRRVSPKIPFTNPRGRVYNNLEKARDDGKGRLQTALQRAGGRCEPAGREPISTSRASGESRGEAPHKAPATSGILPLGRAQFGWQHGKVPFVPCFWAGGFFCLIPPGRVERLSKQFCQGGYHHAGYQTGPLQPGPCKGKHQKEISG